MKKKIICLLFGIVCLYHVGLCSVYTNILYTEPVVLEPSKINLINWKYTLLKMLQDAFFFDNIKNNSVLLVNMIKNDTNGALQTSNITSILIQCITEHVGKYSVIDMTTLNSVYRKLGIFPEDNSNSYNFSIKIAKYLKADYILYGIAYGDSIKPNVELQLILVKSGEILSVVNGSAVI